MPRRSALPLLLATLAAPLAAQDTDFFGAGLAFSGDELAVVKRAPARGPAAIYLYRASGQGWQKSAELRAAGSVERGTALSPTVVATDHGILVGGGDPDNRIGAHAWRRTAAGYTAEDDVALAPAPTDAPTVTLATVMRVLQPAARGLAARGELALVGVDNRAHLFRRSGATWTRVPLELPAAPGTGAALALGDGVGFVATPSARGGRGQVAVIAPDAGGTWRATATIAPDSLPPAAVFGSALAHDGSTLVVGAPGMGAVMVYARQGSAWIEQQRLSVAGVAGLGASIALAGDDLLVGSPRSRTAVRFRRTASGWQESGRLAVPAGADSAGFGSAVAIGPRHLAVGAPFADGARGRVWVFPRTGSGAPVELAPAPSPATITGGERRCTDGSLEGFRCDNVDLQSFLSISGLGGEPGERVTDVWGWTDPVTRREYALVGRTMAYAFVDITEAARPRLVGVLPAGPSGTRGIKVYRDHAYLVADGAGNHGMLVFDLTRLRGLTAPALDLRPDTIYTQIASAHNIAVDTAAGLAIAVASNSGGNTCGGGLHMIDIREPKVPRFAGCYTDTEGLVAPGRTHDVQCTRYHGPDQRHVGRTICLASNETALRIVDVTDPAAPVVVGRAVHPGTGYIHQGWLTEDQRYFFLNDELDELVGTTDRTRTLIWDVSDLDDPVLVGSHLGPDNATDHNLFIRGNRMYLTNYQAGFRVVDVSDPRAPREVGYFDTTPYEGNASGFFGAWGSYPFFESGNVVVTSMQEGMFLLRPRAQVVP